MQFGFVIDHSRCIGCHACTVACKAENDVPVGSFRTWVKYTEQGKFPQVKRSFAVLRCNQCTSAPCIEICPVHALDKRPDGIVDIDPQRCIGCKGCMQACPYDALYINEDSGIAEKCHFCAHRVERGLAPACAVVCPTEAIIPGDFHDPGSRVATLVAQGKLTTRKPEAGTRPNVYYKEADAAGLDPLRTNSAGGFLWAEQTAGPQIDAQLFEQLEQRASARTVYDVGHPAPWGGRVTAYLFTKSISAGAFLAVAPLLPPFSLAAGLGRPAAGVALALALTFLLATALLLILDLKRPERFLYILRHPNWDSWLARGTLVLGGYGLLATLVAALALAGIEPGPLISGAVVVATAGLAALSAVYTAWLFGQARGRVLWLRRGLALELLVHALLAGSAVMLLVAPLAGVAGPAVRFLRWLLAAALLLHLGLVLLERRMAPRGREPEYLRAARLITHGPYARKHWGVGVLAGACVPLALLLLSGQPLWLGVAALLALVGLWVEQDVLVRAGQALPIS